MTADRLKIVIPGGSGSVGTMLARHFHAEGHQVTVLSRSPQPAAWRVLTWDGRTLGNWRSALEGSDVCINLTGKSVNCRYTPANRAEIHDTRTLSTLVLHQAFTSLSRPPRVWFNASTATIYRHSLDRPMDENGEFGGNEKGVPETWNFSIKVAKDWEYAFFSTPTPGTRKVALRSAITFSPDPGSVFEVLSRLVRLGLGGENGSGNQMVSWVHEADFIRAIEWLIAEDRFTGVVNLAAPNPLPNREFMSALRQAWDQPIGLPATAWMIEVGSLLMRTESELVMKSRWVVPGRLLSGGFEFRYPQWPEAARNLVSSWKTRP